VLDSLMIHRLNAERLGEMPTWNQDNKQVHKVEFSVLDGMLDGR